MRFATWPTWRRAWPLRARRIPDNNVPSAWYDEAAHDATHLPGMEGYFAGFASYVATAPDVSDVAQALQAYEASEACPVFAEYTKYGAATRLLVCRNRHPHLA